MSTLTTEGLDEITDAICARRFGSERPAPPDPRDDLHAGIRDVREAYESARMAGATDEQLEPMAEWLHNAYELVRKIQFAVEARPNA